MSRDKKSLVQQTFETLEAKARYGQSRHADKIEGIAQDGIYSFDTMATYKKHCVYFVKWAKELPEAREALGHKPRTLAECRPYVERWLRERNAADFSAWTTKMERSALSKLYGEKIDVDLRSTRRSDITRSRGEAARDRHFSETRNADLVNFCRCAGPRRAELAALRPDALEYHGGKPYIHYTQGTKGGRERLSPLVGTPEEVKAAITYLRGLTGANRVHSAADIHGYRAEYAARVYNAHRRPISDLRGQTIDYTAITGKRHADGSRIIKSAVYYCRRDGKGEAYDRAALLYVSQALGHNREDVVVEDYLYRLVA